MDNKIPFYNLLNMFLIGLVFVGCVYLLFLSDILGLIKQNIVELNFTGFETIVTIIFLGFIYEIGFIINRISSVVFEELLKKFKLIPFEKNYAKYDIARKANPFLNTLSREYALSRNSFSMFVILLILSLIKNNWIFVIIFLFASLLFFFSMRKHSGKIVKIINNSSI